jgi:hypothetical protein
LNKQDWNVDIKKSLKIPKGQSESVWHVWFWLRSRADIVTRAINNHLFHTCISYEFIKKKEKKKEVLCCWQNVVIVYSSQTEWYLCNKMCCHKMSLLCSGYNTDRECNNTFLLGYNLYIQKKYTRLYLIVFFLFDLCVFLF